MNRNKFADETQSVKDLRREFVDLDHIWTLKHYNPKESTHDAIYIELEQEDGYVVELLDHIDRRIDAASAKVQSNRFVGIQIDSSAGMGQIDNPNLNKLRQLQDLKTRHAYIGQVKSTWMTKQMIVFNYNPTVLIRKDIAW